MSRRQGIDLNVLFLSGEQNEADGSRIYRCVYQARQIEQSGGKGSVAFVGDVTARALAEADLVVFSRCLWGAQAIRAIRQARSMGKVVCGDLDDKIYSPWEAAKTGFLRSKSLHRPSADALLRVREAQRSTLRLLPLFDQVLVSTPTIREDLQLLGIPAHVVRNAIDTSQRPPITRARSSLKRILFMTGTRTHDADLRVAVPALARLLEERPELQLTLLGPLGVPDELSRLRNVKPVAKLPLAELGRFVSEHDVCLVPLEPSRFNDCKSALKFLECGLVSVPIIASPRREFVHIIEDGQNGMLAESTADWYRALSRLSESPEMVASMAERAHREVLADHTVTGRAGQLAEHLQALVDVGPTPGLVRLARSIPEGVT